MTLDDFDTALLGDFPEPSRGRTWQRPTYPQHPPRSHPLVLPLRRLARAALRRPGPAGAGPSRTSATPVVLWPTSTATKSRRCSGAPNPRTRTGRRDRTLLLVAVQTGLRASELIGLRCEDVQLGAGAYVRCHGKGRKERCTAATQGCGGGATGVVEGTPRRVVRPRVPQSARRFAQP